MAIEIRTNTPKPQADVAQRTEQGSSKAKVAGSSPAVSAPWPESFHAANDFAMAILQKHKERLAYNAAYQRDLRTIKRLGLEITVSAYRKQKEK